MLKKMILSLTLVGTMLTTNVYPFWGAAESTPGILEKIYRTIIHKPLKKWSKFEAAWPVVGGFLGALFITTFFKTPIKKTTKSIIKSMPDKGFFGKIKWLIQEEDEKKEGKFYEKTKPKKTLTDIVGGKLHQELSDILDDIKNGFEIEPILIHGPKGNGKTTEAEVFSSEIAKIKNAEVILLKTSGAAFLSKYVGESPKKVNELLKEADNISPKDRGMIQKGLELIFKKKNVVIIIDELLSIATGTSGESNHGWATVEALQTAVDNLFPSNNIFLIATSNSTDIPPATLDRFETIYFPETTVDQKVEILEFHINRFSTKYLNTKYGKLSEKCKNELTTMIKDNHELSLRGMMRISRMSASLAKRSKQTQISDENLIAAAKVVIARSSENDRSKDYTRYSKDGREKRHKKDNSSNSLEEIVRTAQKTNTSNNSVNPNDTVQQILKSMNTNKANNFNLDTSTLEKDVPELFEPQTSTNNAHLLNAINEINGTATAGIAKKCVN